MENTLYSFVKHTLLGISTIVKTPITIKSWSTTAIECFAEDPDGDTLSYKWLSDKGGLDGEGANIQYITKSSGEYTVTVIVSDGKGRQTTEKIFFHVPCCSGG